MVNIAPVKSKSTFATVDKFTPPIYVLFFVLVGAKLNIWVVTPFVALIALLYVVCRTLGKSIGAILGSVITKAPVTVRKYLPFCLLNLMINPLSDVCAYTATGIFFICGCVS